MSSFLGVFTRDDLFDPSKYTPATLMVAKMSTNVFNNDGKEKCRNINVYKVPKNTTDVYIGIKSYLSDFTYVVKSENGEEVIWKTRSTGEYYASLIKCLCCVGNFPREEIMYLKISVQNGDQILSILEYNVLNKISLFSTINQNFVVRVDE